ncbi:hypothetical protein Mpsy_1777 [Methanolobus psychrophilus R15]|nr:hypothetical protein Mpsy_1777 [Methanolobus psychrophilus R15]
MEGSPPKLLSVFSLPVLICQMSFFSPKYLTSVSTSIVDHIIFSGGIVEV